MRNQFWVANGAIPTTDSQVAVALAANTILTLIELTVPQTFEIIPVAWGISFNASAAAAPGVVELFETTAAIGSGGTTVVPHKYSNPTGPAAVTTAKFTAATEGTVAGLRMADVQLIAPTNQYIYQWPLGREFTTGGAGATRYLRVRAKFAAIVSCIAWVQWEE